MSEETQGKEIQALAKPKKQNAEDMEAEIRRLELELKQLEVLDARERIDERKLKRDEKGERSRTNGQTLKQNAAADAAAQRRCNHRKGGNGAQGVIAGQGDDTNYAVLKHQFSGGDTWVRCLRCGKTWKPPIREKFIEEKEYLDAYVEYKTALEFQTRNVTSGSLQFRFSDGGKAYRDAMANTTLR